MWLFRRRPAAPSVPTSELVRLRDELAKERATNKRLNTILSHEIEARKYANRRVFTLIQTITEQDATIARLQATQQKQPRDAAGRFVRVAP